MKIMLDMDGVICDFMKSTCEILDVDWDTNYPCPGEWNVFKHCDMNNEDTWSRFGYEFYRELDWTKEGRDIIDLCFDSVSIKNVVLCTSPPKTPGAIEGKIEWIERNIPELSRQFIITPRKEFCCAHDRILIDDANHNINRWHGPKVLVPRIWNTYFHTKHMCLACVKFDLERILKYA